ncbi:hypothetical protein ACVR1G_05325 [Streptococcus dentasini]
MEKQKAKQLYQHGFRLYEEQIATYITEHYSGVKKIEFSPIFIRRGGMQNGRIVPVIYDENGNRAYLGRMIGNNGFMDYGLHDGLELNRDGATDEEIIELEDFDADKTYDVSEYQTLPKFAKLKSHSTIDENIEALVGDRQLKGIKKSDKGSPSVEIVYNTEIKEGDYTKWH